MAGDHFSSGYHYTVWEKGERNDSRVERRGQAMVSGAWKEENGGRRSGVYGVLGEGMGVVG